MKLGVLIFYLLILIAMGVWSGMRSRGTARDYSLASQTIGPVLLLLSLFGTTMTSFALVGSTGESYVTGVGIFGKLATAAGIVHSACFFIVGVRLWKYGKRFGFTTQIQYFRDRLQSDAVGLLLFPVLVGLVIPYMLIGLLGGGITIETVTAGSFESLGWFEGYNHGVPAWLAGLVISLVVLTYVFLGGMRGTAWANALQTAFFVVLASITFVVIVNKYGQGGAFFESLQRLTENAFNANPEKLSKAPIPYSQYAAYLLIPLSVAMFPHVFQHWLTARSDKTFKLAIVCHPLMVLCVWMPCVLMGVWATAIPVTSGLPPDRANTVLGTLVNGIEAPFLAGLLSAGILAAIMSSLDSQFLALGTMFTNDIVTHYVGEKRFSEHARVWIARVFVVLVVAVTYGVFLVALQYRASVFPLGTWCFTGFTGLFPVVFASLYWKRFTKYGAAASILATAVTWLWLFWKSDFGGDKAYAFPESPLAIGGTTILPPLHPIVTVTVVSALAAILVSLFTKPPSQAVVDKYFPSESD